MSTNEKLIYTNKELPQGSPEWRRLYQETLGGSETACLMFSSYSKTIDSLWEEKVAARRGVVLRPVELKTEEDIEAEKQHQANMDRGNLLEPRARLAYEKKYRCRVDQMVLIHPDPNLRFLRTSLDGIKRNRKVIQEFKCPKDLKNHERFTKGLKVPTWRYPQLQHQFGVTSCHFPQLERVDYVSCYFKQDKRGRILKTDMVTIPVFPDWDYINELFRRARVFMGYVEREERPPVNLFREGERLIARVKKATLPTNGVKYIPVGKAA